MRSQRLAHNQILNSSSGSTDNYPADFTTYGDIRHARNNRGRAAKEKNSDGTWYYIRRKGYLLAGDEGADLYMFGVKKWDRSDNAELVKCVIQNDLPPTNAQVMGETRPNNLGIQGHRYSVGSPPKWVSTTRRQHDRLIPSTERSTGHELRKTFSPTRGSLTALGNGASNKVQHAPDVSHIDESTSLRVKKFGLADTLSQDVNNLKSLVLYGFPRENTLDEWSTPSPAENAASACNIAPRLAEQRGLSRNTPSSPDEGNVGEGLDNHASPMRSTSASHGLPQVANSEAGVGPRRPDPESTLPYPIDSVSEERSEECIDDLDTLRSLSPQPEEHDRCQDCAVTNLLGALKSVKSMGETNRETLKTLRDVAKHLWKDHSESGRELHKRVETSFRATRQSVFQYRAACNHLPVLQSLATGRECAEYEALLENGDDIIEEIGGKEFLDMLMETKTS